MEKVRVTKVNVVKDGNSTSKKVKGRTKRGKKSVDESIENVEYTKVTLDAPVAKEIRNEVIDEAAADKANFVDSEDTFNNPSVKHREGIPGKAKKIRKHKPVGRAGFIAICTCTSIFGAALGCVSGYFLYNHFKPEETYEASFSDFNELRERAKKNPNLLEEFKDDKYNIINLAFDKYTTYKNTLTLGYGEVNSSNGLQIVHSATIGGEQAFNQNVSYVDKAKFSDVKTAYRFYYDTADLTSPKINAYEKNVPADWTADMSITKTYTPDEYIEKYGKLNYGSYIVDADNKFVTLGSEGEGKVINGVSIYQFTDKSVANCNKASKNEAGYEFDFTLKCKTACRYYAAQIKTNGGLSKNPSFAETLNIKFQLNENYELVSSYVTEEYGVVAYGVNAKCSSTMSQKYFYTNDEKLVLEGNEITVPEIGSQFVVDMDDTGKIISTKAN